MSPLAPPCHNPSPPSVPSPASSPPLVYASRLSTAPRPSRPATLIQTLHYEADRKRAGAVIGRLRELSKVQLDAIP
ncbi:hypothetical protein E2C01_095238 [Portunus trituberculatus]|uniref:Uncharacterized protein n=1 Tax=Portunus trituberculatus TaxID=210409 RepID=A0A5B7JSJ9_PORTR|nr:hypothetical protein [Portunus trituberculatus]